jgi:hypothetical protein
MTTLPERPSLDWLKKTAKQQLDMLHTTDPDAKLADVQRMLARDYGFPSWRKLKAHVEVQTAPAQPTAEDAAAAFLLRVAEGDIDRVRAAIAVAPGLCQYRRTPPLLGWAAATSPPRDRTQGPGDDRPAARHRRKRERP